MDLFLYALAALFMPVSALVIAFWVLRDNRKIASRPSPRHGGAVGHKR